MLDPITPSTESEIEFKREVKHSLNADMLLQTRKRNCCGVPEFFQLERAQCANGWFYTKIALRFPNK